MTDFAKKNNIPVGFDVTQWILWWKKRENQVLSLEKRQSTNTESQIEREAYSFHHFVQCAHIIVL